MSNNGQQHLDVKVVSRSPERTCLGFFVGEELVCHDFGDISDASVRRAISDRVIKRVPTISQHQVEEQLLPLVLNGASRPNQNVAPVKAREFVEQFPKLRPVVIEGIARIGETVNIISSSKIGKSWLVYLLLLCVAAGRKWLDTFQCVQGRALLIDNELHPETLARRLDAVAYAMGLSDGEWRDSLDVICLRGRGIDLNTLESTIKTIEPNTYALVVADAWYRFMPQHTDENSNADVMRLYNLIDMYVAHLIAVWVNIHHSSKGDQSGKSVTDVGSGAGSQSRAADSHLILRPHEQDGVVVLEAAVRSFPPVEPLALRWEYPLWSRADDADPKKLKRRVSAADEKRAADDADGIAKIIAKLAKHQKGTTRRLTEWTGMSGPRINKLIVQLRDEGRIVSEEITVRGNTCDEHHLAPAKKDDVCDGF